MTTLVNTLIASFFPVIFVPQHNDIASQVSDTIIEVTVCEKPNETEGSDIYIFL